MTDTYTCEGDVRGCCGVTHRTMTGAVRCLEADQAGCASQGSYSDRAIYRSDGQRMVAGIDGDGRYSEYSANRDYWAYRERRRG
jgi:hypothetical protein